MIDFKKKLKELKNPVPFQHPPLQEGYVREVVGEFKAETSKARLITFEDGLSYWIPKKVSKVQFYNGHNHPKDVDKETVIDIESWFYSKNLIPK